MKKRNEYNEGRIRNLLWIGMEFATHRYLFANTHGRLDGNEKAERHLELSKFYIASRRSCAIDDADEHWGEVMRIHNATSKLTSYLDQEIGFPIFDSDIDYDEMSRKFFDRFIEIADAEWEAIEKEADA